MSRIALFLLLVFTTATAVVGQEIDIYDSGGPILPEQAAYDVTHYELNLVVDPALRRISGHATTTAEVTAPLGTFVLDLDTLLTVSAIREVRSEGLRDLSWERRGGRLWIDLGGERPEGQMVSVRVEYGGSPRVAPRAPWDGGFVWATTADGYPWIATSVQGHGPDVWWPAKDHVSDKPDSMTIRITVPEPLVVATNGRLTGVEVNDNGSRTYEWFVSNPISAYNVALNIAPYVEIEEEYRSVTGETIPVVFYVLPEDEARGQVFMPEILDHLSFFERNFGPYPFRADKYGVAQTPHLGMEHQTIIAYGARFNNSAMTGRDWGFDALHHHELSHEWFGNLVTNSDWKDMWIHEGFGTYTQALYAEELSGPDQYLEYLLANRRGFANAAPVAPIESRTAGQIYFDSGSDIYSKGAWVLHTLRYLIGQDALIESMRRMAYPDPSLESVTDGSQVRHSDTDEFIEIAQRVAGQDLSWFFDMYVRQPELPRLSAERIGNRIRIEWQVPGDLPFPMPVEVKLGDEVRRISMPARGATELSLPPGEVTIDPSNWILREGQQPIVLP